MEKDLFYYFYASVLKGKLLSINQKKADNHPLFVLLLNRHYHVNLN